ncbi:MAG: hypothetical protein EOM91_12185 [Sphingobacteriia bacterium]|jgi:hypothetical protein|nr:hypothetical protein [Sphingobacteriia bacterium]
MNENDKGNDYQYGSHVVTKKGEVAYVTNCSGTVCRVKKHYERGRPSVIDKDELREVGLREAEDVREAVQAVGNLLDAAAGSAGVETYELFSSCTKYIAEQAAPKTFERHQESARKATGHPGKDKS